MIFAILSGNEFQSVNQTVQFRLECIFTWLKYLNSVSDRDKIFLALSKQKGKLNIEIVITKGQSHAA